MIHLIIHLQVQDAANVDTVRELLTELGRLSREEPGCLRYDVYQSQTDSTIFHLTECWESQEALDVHRQAEGFVRIYGPQVLPLAERIPHPSTLLT